MVVGHVCESAISRGSVTASRLGSTTITMLLVYYVKEAWYLLTRTSVLKREKF